MKLPRVQRAALTAALTLAGSVALADSSITTEVPPPAARVEIAPATRDGYLWSPGYWAWSGRAYYWIPGNWLVQRRGAHYVGDPWEQVGARWRFTKGHWER